MASAFDLAVTAIPVGRRRAPRVSVCLAARVETLSGCQPATLLSLSTSGAMVAADRLPAPGNYIILFWESVEAFGVVVWSQDGRCGISFDEALSDETVLAARWRHDNDPAVQRAASLAAVKARSEGRKS